MSRSWRAIASPEAMDVVDAADYFSRHAYAYADDAFTRFDCRCWFIIFFAA